MTSSALTKLSIIGAGGHCRSVIALLEEQNLEISAIFDASYSAEKKENILGYHLAGSLDDAWSSGHSFVLAIGDNAARWSVYQEKQALISPRNIISKHALVRDSVTMGNANLVFPMVFLNAECLIGDNNIINSKALIEHESVIGSHCHISVGAVIAGRVTIGSNCFIGAGAIIRDKVSICDSVTVGAGAVVVKNITEPGVYIGNPLKKLR